MMYGWVEVINVKELSSIMVYMLKVIVLIK